MEKVSADKSVFEEILAKCSVFYSQAVCHHLFRAVVDSRQVTLKDSPSTSINYLSKTYDNIDVSNTLVQYVDFDTANNECVQSVDLCPVCRSVCSSDPVVSNDLSIQCSMCSFWFHFGKITRLSLIDVLVLD